LQSLFAQEVYIKTDLIVLNGLYCKKPVLAHDIIYEGKLIINTNNEYQKNITSIDCYAIISMAGLRNLLIHEYVIIDVNQLYVLINHLYGLKNFRRVVKTGF